jgi:drug/metabolite transporter (DMT)-like permease
MVVLLCLLPGQRQTWGEFKLMRSPRFFAVLAGTSFASTFLAIWLQQIALKFTAAGIAQSLTSTSPLFVIPIAMARGEQVSSRAIAGVLMALGGVWLLFLQR